VAIFDRLITETAQEGIYIVYLFREDAAGIYISLNQGVTTVRRAYGADAKEALRARAHDYFARLGPVEATVLTGPIDLGVGDSSSLGAFYEQGSIAAKFYERVSVPPDEVRAADLRAFLLLYQKLAGVELTVTTTTTSEEDEEGLGDEDLTSLREHKRIERNRKLAQRAKQIHGYTCQACGLSFETFYGPIGKNYIEAHHLTPLHRLKGQRVTLNPSKDFAVLCSNCHRMIHRSGLVDQVDKFKTLHVDRKEH
jgi:5-methylcytosine-specific restriction protein A